MTQGLTMASAVTEGNVPEPCQLKNKTLRALPNVGAEQPALWDRAAYHVGLTTQTSSFQFKD